MGNLKKNEQNAEIQSIWLKARFYVLLTLATLITCLYLSNHPDNLNFKENIAAAVLSYVNALAAYIISTKKYDNKDYKNMVRTISTWMIVRVSVLIALSLTIILTGIVNPAYYIFSLIGFYLLHQLILVFIMRKEAGIGTNIKKKN